MKREKPDLASLKRWISERCLLSEHVSNTARGLWLWWSAYAEETGVAAGTPRSFSNELRKLGHPCARHGGPRLMDGRLTPKTRVHLGIKARFEGDILESDEAYLAFGHFMRVYW